MHQKKPELHYLEAEFYDLLKQDTSIFEFIQNSLLDGLWYWDLEHPEHEWMNARFWETLGYNPEEMEHSPSAWQHLIFEEDLQTAKDKIEKHLADPDYPYDQVVRYRHQDGSTVWIRCYGKAIRKEGKAVRMLGAHHDITAIQQFDELAKSNRKLISKQRELDRVQKITKTGSFYVDFHTDEVTWSGELYRMFGLDRSKPAPTFAEQNKLYTPDSLRQLKEAVRRTEETGEPYELEIEYFKDQDVTGWMWVRGERVSSFDRIVGLWGVARDITDEVLQREKLMELSETREKLATLGTLTSGIAHEINNPNQMILSNTQFLESCAAELESLFEGFENELPEDELMGIPLKLLPKKMSEAIRTIKGGSDRIKTIVAEIKNYTRNQPYELDWIDLNRVVYSAQTLTAYFGKSKTDHFDWFAEKELMILGNFQKLEQVMVNILMNAFESLSEKRQSVVIHSFKDNHEAVVSIADEGAGIPDEILGQIADPFFTTKQEKGGTGMGLSVVSKILKEHGATMHFEKNKPGGTTVTLRFPLQKEEDQPLPKQ